MRKHFARLIVVLAAVGLLSGLLVTPAGANTPVCTPQVDPLTITVAGQDFRIHDGVTSVCGEVPDIDPSDLPTAHVYQDESGAYHVVVHGTKGAYSICMLGVNDSCLVWLDKT